MSDWSLPPGDVGAIEAASRTLASMANDLGSRIATAKTAVQTALTDWTGPRSDDFEHAAQALVDELGLTATAAATGSRLLWAYAQTLQQAITDIGTYKNNYDRDAGSEPENLQHWVLQAQSARTDVANYARTIADAFDQETGLAVPNCAHLSAAEIARRVDSTLGVDDGTRGEYLNGAIGDDAAWRLLQTADGPVFDAGAPRPGDAAFRAWYAGLTAAQQLLYVQHLQTSFPPKDFSPYDHLQGGPMPQWATSFNDMHGTMCSVDGGLAPGYGYFGGGTILGPGGSQWPILMPYYNDGKHVYMADDGQARGDGGIEQLDGNDPGWHTVSTYTGLGQFGSVSTTTKLLTAFLIGTGQELETTSTDPGAVRVGPDGTPFAGHDVEEIPGGPPDKAWWDVDSDVMMPKPLEGLPAGSIQPDLEYNEAALGANALLVQAGQAFTATQNEQSHAERQWYVSYQVNDDGRTRAIVHTYTAGPGEDGKTIVGSFANAFPTGASGSTNEIPYNTRFNEYTSPVITAQPDDKIEYSGHGEPIENTTPIPEKLDK